MTVSILYAEITSDMIVNGIPIFAGDKFPVLMNDSQRLLVSYFDPDTGQVQKFSLQNSNNIKLRFIVVSSKFNPGDVVRKVSPDSGRDSVPFRIHSVEVFSGFFFYQSVYGKNMSMMDGAFEEQVRAATEEERKESWSLKQADETFKTMTK